MSLNDLAFLTPVARRNLKELAYEQLRTGLIRGRFSPGYPLTVRGVAEALGISPMPVRAALDRLEAEGALVARDGNRTLAVPELTIEAYRELREIRIMLEGLAAQKAAEAIVPHELEVIEQAVSAMQAAVDAGDVDGYLSTNWQFHFGVYRSSRMPALVSMIESLWLRVGAYVRWMMPDSAALERSMPNHWLIADALKQRDAVAARRAIEADILESSDHLLSMLGASSTSRVAAEDIPT
ncbi:MAG: GntR family transcriptional regulator [Bosea sp.]|uniref:GntR family transcriptional regulator n=1 Tax=Bosea sp. (in: a-proteobacteria) TaxID=1871050 RepID=UPI001ACF403C|nr:GntR family transcriptional regulator [Bosea sp. (in: a-proteobacteria)]MBN9451493.1 GntR family transcriptional regulator [Bosea sp. (in: a-proteobacteria)]